MSATKGWKGRKKRLFERKEALKKRSNPTEECMNWGGLKFPKFGVKRLKRDVLQFSQLWHDIHL